MPVADNDILSKLDRLLDVTPEHAFAAPPISRRTLAAAAAEIRRLRAKLALAERASDVVVPQE